MTLPRRRRLARLPDSPPALDPAGAAELAAVHELARAAVAAREPAELFQSTLDRLAPRVGATLAAIYLVDGASELMRLVAAHRWPERFRPWLSAMRVRVGFGPSGEAVAERRTIEIPDLLADGGVEDWREVAEELGVRALLAVPLVGEREVLGVATFCFADGAALTPLGRLLARIGGELLALAAERMRGREASRRAEAALAEAQRELDRASADAVTAREELALLGAALEEARRDPSRLEALADLVAAARGTLDPEREECDPRAPLREAIHRAGIDPVTLDAPVLALEPLRGDRRRITRLLVSLLEALQRRAPGVPLRASVAADAHRVVYRLAAPLPDGWDGPLGGATLAQAVARALGGALTVDEAAGAVTLDLPLQS